MLSPCEDVSNGSPEKSDTQPSTPSKRSLYRLTTRFGLKSIKITGEAGSADEGAAATFPAK